MSRKNIFAILAEKYDTEIAKITALFHSKTFSSIIDSSITIEELVDIYAFYNWKSRGTCLNCEDMRNSLGLTTSPKKIDDINEILNYLEYYINMCYLATRAKPGEYQKNKNFAMLEDNIKKLIGALNHELKIIKSEEKVLIIPKNPAGTAVAEISSEQTGLAILKYHHYLLKGNLSEKRRILQEIANEYEDILKTGTPKEVFSQTRALLNKLGIRHGNKENKNNVAKFNNAKLEELYDDLYQMLLLCVLLNNYYSCLRKKTDELLDSLKDNKK
jgi:hypothetical protein